MQMLLFLLQLRITRSDRGNAYADVPPHQRSHYFRFDVDVDRKWRFGSLWFAVVRSRELCKVLARVKQATDGR